MASKKNHSEIYSKENDLYDYLVSREDFQNKIDHFLDRLVKKYHIENVLELGVGSGRLTQIIAPLVKRVEGFDKYQHMLDKANENLLNLGIKNVELKVGEHIEFKTDSKDFDLILAGWTLSYLTEDQDPSDMSKLERCLKLVRNFTHERSIICIIETLGTGNKEPKAPLKRLENMYSYLEEKGFRREVLRTDYLFEDRDKAHNCLRQFFDERIANLLEKNNESFILPECTGFWIKESA